MIKNITVVGAGRMGRGIAAVYARRGYNVTMHDLEEGILEQARQGVRSILGFLLEKELITEDEVDSSMSRIRSTLNLEEAMEAADLVNESIQEVMGLKKELFSRMDKLCGKKTILATNTSSLSNSELAAATSRPDRVVGIHWVYPPYIIPAVEVIVGKQTSDLTLSTAKDLVIKLGKVPIVCKDVPGFVINRMQQALFNEAGCLLEQGVATAEDIDNAARMVMGLRFPFWGPLRVEDITAPATTVLTVQEYLYKVTGSDKFRPTKLLREKVRKGELGLVSGKGYYDYSKEPPGAIAREMDNMLIEILRFLAKLGYANPP